MLGRPFPPGRNPLANERSKAENRREKSCVAAISLSIPIN